MSEPRISALFSTFNRRALLRLALQSLERQSLGRDDYEVIVVDDGSTDGTESLEREFAGVLPLTWVRQENLGLAAGKNRALSVARAPIVVFMDDDDVASPQLLEEHLRAHARYPAQEFAVLGYTDLAPDVASQPLMHFVTQVGCYLFGYPRLSHGRVLDHTYFWGGRSSCKASLLKGIEGPFDPIFRFGCEDVELAHRLVPRGLKVVFNREARTTMVRSISFDGFCRRIERQGESNWRFLQKHPSDAVRAWTQLDRLEEQWARIADQFTQITAAAKGLDAIVDARIRHRVEVDDALLAMLHDHYWAAFDAHRVRGSWRASQERPPSADSRAGPAPCR